MQVQTMPLWPGISLVIVWDKHEPGWRFSSWSKYTGILVPPPQEEQARWFDTAEDAASHFRSLCPRT